MASEVLSLRGRVDTPHLEDMDLGEGEKFLDSAGNRQYKGGRWQENRVDVVGVEV